MNSGSGGDGVGLVDHVLGHARGGGIDHAAVELGGALALCRRLFEGDENAPRAVDFVGRRRHDLVGQFDLRGVDRPLALVAHRRGASRRRQVTIRVVEVTERAVDGAQAVSTAGHQHALQPFVPLVAGVIRVQAADHDGAGAAARGIVGDAEVQDRWRDWIDISGAYVISTFRANVPGLLAADLGADRDVVVLTVERDGAMWDVTVPRSRVAAVNPHQLLVYMVLAAALLSVIAALFMANQVRPIRRLALAAEAFGKGQSVELYPRGASEVRAATNAFLSMRARIERQIEQRTAMLSGVSHDLRSPLTRLRLSLSLLDAGEEAALMGRDIDDMEAILDEFLAFARGDAGEESEEVAIKAFAKALAKNARRAGQELELIFDGQAADDPKVRMRRLSVQRGVSNLLANARKYASAARLTVYLGTGFIDFIVEDNGPGIARDAHETAMKPFSRLDAARNQDKGSGVGLGLAITADIARSHGGELSLGRSEQMGGLRANLRLPR